MRQLAQNGLDDSIINESGSFSNHSGYDVHKIYADVNKINRLMSKGAENA